MQRSVVSTLALAGLWAVAMLPGRSLWAEQPSQDAPRQSRQSIPSEQTRDGKLHFWLYLPPGYDKQPQKKWPLLLFLHGAGERGSDLKRVLRHGPPKLIQAGKDFPFLVASPQCPGGMDWRMLAPSLIKLLDHLESKYRVDPSRVYVTGLSMGGYGTWHLAGLIPERLAAVVPICGGGDPATAERLKEVPVWAFHGGRDRVVPLKRSQEMVDAINKAGGKARLTVYPEAGHDSWSATYDNPEVYRWLLSHQKPRSK